MNELLPFLIAGLTSGSVYGLAAVGLVLTYKTSGVFNFAHGALATVSAFVFYTLNVSHGVPWLPAAAICVLVVGPVLGILLELVARRVSTTTLEYQVGATIGLLLFIEAAVSLTYSQGTIRSVPQFLPSGGFSIAGTQVQWSDLITFTIAVVVTVLLSLAFQFTRRGKEMRAVVQNPDLLDLTGTSPITTRRLAWCLGAATASLSGVLFAPLLPLDPLQLTLLIVQAFGAAAIGRFTSLPFSFAGGLLVGVVSSVATKYFTSGLLSGLPTALPFVALFVVLLVLPKRFLVSRSISVRRVRTAWQAPVRGQIVLGTLVLAFLVFVPSFAGVHLTDWTVGLAMVIVFLSLGLLVRTSGQVSLCHVTFTAIGATAFSHLAVGAGLPWPLALVVTGLIAVPIGALLSIPAIRLSGLYLALATFGFGIVVQVMFYTESYMFGSSGLGLNEPRPGVSWLSSDTGFYEVVLVISVLATATVILLNRSRLGRLLRGLADSPLALRTSGVTVDVTRVMVFCISAFMAAVGGALAAMAQTTVSGDSYQPLQSLTYFAVIVLVVGREPWYALLASFAIVVIPSYVNGSEVDTWLQLVFGAGAIAVAMTAGRLSMPTPVRLWLSKLARTPRQGPRPRPAVASTALGGAAATKVESAVLQVRALGVRFSGVKAVDGLDLVAQTGRITGLIGPNGAGKTTTFNACTGLVRAASGAITLASKDITRRSAPSRARMGLGRTFQQMQLFDSLTVTENVAIGAEGALAGSNPLAHIVGSRAQTRHVRTATVQALALCGITSLATRRAGDLSTGQRRLVELARCLAGPYRIVLLDEPSSGLDHAESERFGEILREVVVERGIGILLVEHDMSLVLDVCDDIFVLDFGRPLFTGTPEQVRRSPIVQAAYLGEAAEPAEPPLAGHPSTVGA